MSFIENVGTETVLAAATPTEILGAAGLDITLIDVLSFQLLNSGTNPITGLAVYWSNDPTGAVWSTADSTITLPGGTLAASAVFTVERDSMSFRRMRIVVTSALSSKVKLYLAAKHIGLSI